MDKDTVAIIIFTPAFLLMGFVLFIWIKQEIDEARFHKEYRENGYSYYPKPEKVKFKKRKETIDKILNKK